MKTKDAIKHFGSPSELAAALGIKPPSIYSWGRTVPWQRQLEIERLTKGALKHDPTAIPENLRGVVERAA